MNVVIQILFEPIEFISIWISIFKQIISNKKGTAYSTRFDRLKNCHLKLREYPLAFYLKNNK